MGLLMIKTPTLSLPLQGEGTLLVASIPPREGTIAVGLLIVKTPSLPLPLQGEGTLLASSIPPWRAGCSMLRRSAYRP